MSQAINTTAAFAALDKFAASTDTARTTLCAALIRAGITTREDAMPVVTAWAAVRAGCPMVDGKGKAKGTMVLDRTHATYEAAKKARYRVMEALTPSEKPAGKPAGKPADKKEARPLTRAEIAALKVALAACGGNVARAVAGIKALSA